MFRFFSKDKKGFTLAEMLVVMFIFSILSVGLANIFVKYFASERASFAKQKISADLRFSLETMVREIRLNNIDYRDVGYYSGNVSSPNTVLALLDSSGNQILFGLNGADCQTNDNCFVYVRRNGTDYRITPDDIAVRDLQFYISPNQDPFTLQANGSFLDNEQPRVLIMIEEQYIGTGGGVEVPAIKMQTMASSKIYQR